MKKFFRNLKRSISRRRHKDPLAVLMPDRKVHTLQNMTYMQAVLILFLLSVALLTLAIVRTCVSGGNSGIWSALGANLALILSLMGLLLTVYGHFYVRREGKLSWKFGLWGNGIILAITVIIFLAGLE